MTDYTALSLAQCGDYIQSCDESLSDATDVLAELQDRVQGKPEAAKHLFKFHADLFEETPSAQRVNELYAMMRLLQFLHSGGKG